MGGIVSFGGLIDGGNFRSVLQFAGASSYLP